MTLDLKLTDDEADAVLLGLQLIIMRDDEDVRDVACDLADRIVDMTPRPEPAPVARPPSTRPGDWPAMLTEAIAREAAVEIVYVDRRGVETRRCICPILPPGRGDAGYVAAWCERRQDYRHFRLDRIRGMTPTAVPYSRRHRLLLAEWRAIADLDDFF
ncbi:WYL domain-containing protein [uncultured Brevundimonas sp.]|uniref:helix-turn-helix transcriptional regulator n=1 Tax=uncultured Brevundimonas sp. TaxID=213418 RepID=UPI0026252D96|nr:WYL domain-containing protein [uncultured Brevundimonas sp.]